MGACDAGECCVLRAGQCGGSCQAELMCLKLAWVAGMLLLFVLRRQNGITAVVNLIAVRVEYSLLQVPSTHAAPLICYC